MSQTVLSLQPPSAATPRVVVIGGGPAGLMAAEVLAQAGCAVDLYDAMASVGRKFLLAGKGGLNLTHSEAQEPFLGRYAERSAALAPAIGCWGAQAVRDWAQGLGVSTFVGSSGRVFPVDMKAAPLLRAWLHRLRGQGVRFHMRHRWQGWSEDASLRFQSPAGESLVSAQAVVLALGGGSWARLGSDGAWVPWLQAQGVPVKPLRPANCGFDLLATPACVHAGQGQGWSPFFSSRYAGQPFKSVALHFEDGAGLTFHRRGEFVATATGVEGSLIYAVAAMLRERIASSGSATLLLDLLPDHSAERVLEQCRYPRGARSLSSHLKGRLGLDGIKMALLNEVLGREQLLNPAVLAATIKAVPLTLGAPRPLDEAISSAGGVPFEALDAQLMLQARPGVFCAGEMLDWEAPTGGYLLTASLATGRQAARGVLNWLNQATVQGNEAGSTSAFTP